MVAWARLRFVRAKSGTASAIACVALLAGCSAEAKQGTSDADDGGTKRIAFVMATSASGYTPGLADGFRSGTESVKGVEQVVVGPPTVDAEKQLGLFNDAVKTNADGIALNCLTPGALVAPVSAAVRNKVPVLMVDNTIPTSSGSKLYIGNDNRELGKLLADQLVASLPADVRGTVVVGASGLGNPVFEKRLQGIASTLQSKRPLLAIVGPYQTEYDENANRASWKKLVSENPNAVAVIGVGDVDVYNLTVVRKESGGRWLIGGFGLDSRALGEVKNGNLVMVSPEHFVKGHIAGYLLANHAKNGKPLPEGWINVPGLVVTQDNVDLIIAAQNSFESRKAWYAPRAKAILREKPLRLDDA